MTKRTHQHAQNYFSNEQRTSTKRTLYSGFDQLVLEKTTATKISELYQEEMLAYEAAEASKVSRYFSQLSRFFKTLDSIGALSEVRWISDELQLARVVYLLRIADKHGVSKAVDALQHIAKFADEGELRALLAAMPWLDDVELSQASRLLLLNLAREGCRTNSTNIFKAIALSNPFPAMAFDEAAWNQMVIKCVFLALSVFDIVAFDERLNPELARIAMDLIEERDAAGRAISIDLWLCLGSYENERLMARANRSITEQSYQDIAHDDSLLASLALLRAQLPLPPAARTLLARSPFKKLML